MNKKLLVTLLCAGALVLATAGTSSAATIAWSGTSVIALGGNPGLNVTEAGVATITATAGGKLTSFKIQSIFAGTNTVPLTDPNTAELVTLTTNASQLARFAAELAGCGVKRVNISLDTLDPEKFHAITRWGDLDGVLRGIGATVAMRPKFRRVRRPRENV